MFRNVVGHHLQLEGSLDWRRLYQRDARLGEVKRASVAAGHGKFGLRIRFAPWRKVRTNLLAKPSGRDNPLLLEGP